MSKFLKGFIFGSVIGGAVALLNNPRSGKENREILSKQIQEVTQDVTVINTGKATLQRGIKELQEVIVPQTMEVVNSIQEEVTKFQLENKPRFRRIQDKIQTLQTHLKEMKQRVCPMIKLFASDMDGTLLTNHVEVHKNNIQAIRKLQKQGQHFIVCTGRDYLQANLALEQAELHLPVIAMNGAQIFDKNHNIIWEVTIPHDTVYTLLDYFNSIDLDWQLVTSEGNFRKNYALFINKVIERKKAERNNLSPEQLKEEIRQLKTLLEATDVTTAEEVLSIPDIKVFKIIVSHDDGPTFFKPVREHIDQAHPNLVVTSAFITDLEINHKDAQKGIAVAHYAKTLGLSMKQVFGIGDNFNDVSMIRDAGIGVAMGNAPDEVKAIADFVTDTNVNGGVAKAIWRVLEQEK